MLPSPAPLAGRRGDRVGISGVGTSGVVGEPPPVIGAKNGGRFPPSPSPPPVGDLDGPPEGLDGVSPNVCCSSANENKSWTAPNAVYPASAAAPTAGSAGPVNPKIPTALVAALAVLAKLCKSNPRLATSPSTPIADVLYPSSVSAAVIVPFLIPEVIALCCALSFPAKVLMSNE